MDELEEKGVLLPIDWHVPSSLTSRYANQFVIQHTHNEFIISFFEILPPLVLGSPEEQKEQLEKIGSVKAECVTRVIIAADKMPEFIDLLKNNLDKFNAKKAGDE